MEENLKQLLLKDLCARLPYGVKIKLGDYDYQVCGYNSEKKPLPLMIWYYYRNNSKSLIDVYLEDYYPYLRPLSSMTEEEKHELYQVFQECPTIIKTYPAYAEFFIYADIINSIDMANVIDWLNAHHFDYRGLIEKGLALEARKGMYNIKEK